MKFDDFDREMRVYEESLDQYILPDMYLVARLDGRSFTRLTKELCQFEAPFDVRFRDLMTDKHHSCRRSQRSFYACIRTCGHI